jgi:hypothetical protein
VRQTVAGATYQPQQQPQPLLYVSQQDLRATAAEQLSRRHVRFSAAAAAAKVPVAVPSSTAKLQTVPLASSASSDVLLLQKLSRELERKRSAAVVAASADAVRRVALRNSKVRTLRSSAIAAVSVTLPAVQHTATTTAADAASRSTAKQRRQRERPASAPTARPLQDATAATVTAAAGAIDCNGVQLLSPVLRPASAQSPTRHAVSPQRQQQQQQQRQHVAGCYGDYCYLLHEHSSAQQPPVQHAKKVYKRQLQAYAVPLCAYC